MVFLQPYLILGGVVLGMMTVLWLVSLALKNSSIVDIFLGSRICSLFLGGIFSDPRRISTPKTHPGYIGYSVGIAAFDLHTP